MIHALIVLALLRFCIVAGETSDDDDLIGPIGSTEEYEQDEIRKMPHDNDFTCMFPVHGHTT